jgi:hypothetical protein
LSVTETATVQAAEHPTVRRRPLRPTARRGWRDGTASVWPSVLVAGGVTAGGVGTILAGGGVGVVGVVGVVAGGVGLGGAASGTMSVSLDLIHDDWPTGLVRLTSTASWAKTSSPVTV